MGFFKLFKTIWRENPKTDVKKTEPAHIDEFKYKTVIETRLQDYDFNGSINPNMFPTYLEIGRERYCDRALKWNFQKSLISVGQLNIDFILPIYRNEPVSMYIRTAMIGQSSFDLEYLIVKTIRNEEYICCRAKTVCLTLDKDSKHAVVIPPIEKNKMKAFELL